MTVKRGHTVVKIYLTPSRGCDAYTVVHYIGSKGVYPAAFLIESNSGVRRPGGRLFKPPYFAAACEGYGDGTAGTGATNPAAAEEAKTRRSADARVRLPVGERLR